MRVQSVAAIGQLYAANVIAGGQAELESITGQRNDDVLKAEPILDGERERLAVSGVLSGNDVDTFVFTMEPGQSVSAMLDGFSTDNVHLELLDEVEQVIVSGQVAGNADRIAEHFNERDTPTTLFLRVSGSDTPYNLALAKNAAFEFEGNNRPRHAQDITGTDTVFGYLALPSGTGARSSVSTLAAIADHETRHIGTLPSERTVEQDAPSQFVPDRLLVRFHSHIPAENRPLLIEAWGGMIEKELGVTQTLIVKLENSDLDVPEIASQWSARSEVRYAEPDFLVSGYDSQSDDPLFRRLLGFENTGQIGGTPDADVDASEAWEVATGSHRIVVASIDSGVDYTHTQTCRRIFG